MSEPDNILKINVHEEIKMKDVGLGGSAPSVPPTSTEEVLTPEERVQKEKAMAEYIRLMGRYIEPHKVKSRWVTRNDIPRVLRDAQDLVTMCGMPRGKHVGIAALASTQIDNKDPLRFFVLPNGMVVINAVITGHTTIPIFREEGCLSYPDRNILNLVSRYNKIVVTYQTLSKMEGLDKPILSNPITEELNGNTSHVFQHEISHLNGHYVYDSDYNVEFCLGLGDGPISEKEKDKLYE